MPDQDSNNLTAVAPLPESASTVPESVWNWAGQDKDTPELEKPSTPSPLDLYYQKFPDDKNAPQERVLATLRSKMAPDLPVDQFNTLVTKPDGFKAIENAKRDYENALSPLERYRKQFPADSQISDDQISKSVYNKLIAAGKLDGKVTDFDTFKTHFNPPSPALAAAYNFQKGAIDQSQAEVHSFNQRFWSSPDDTYKAFYGLLDAAFPGYAFDNKPNSPGAGTRMLKLGDQIEQWINQNWGGDMFQQLWQKTDGFLQNQAKVEQTAAQQAQDQASQASGVAGNVGRFAGGTATSIGLNAPITAALGATGTTGKLAYLLSTTYMGTTAYGAAADAGSENALLDGAKSALMAPLMRYMFGSSAGRMRIGLTNAVMGAGSDPDMWNIISGKDPHYLDFAMRRTTDAVLGAWMGGKKEAEGVFPPEGPATEKPRVRVQAAGRRITAEEAWPSGFGEEMDKALEAHQDGNTKLAASHVDKAAAMLTKDQQQKLAQTVIDNTNHNWEDQQARRAQLWGFKPRQVAKSPESVGSPENTIRNAYDDLKAKTGRSSIHITDLIKESGLPAEQVKAWLKSEAGEKGKGQLDEGDIGAAKQIGKGDYVDFMGRKRTLVDLSRRGEAGYAMNPAELLKNDNHTGLLDRWDTVFHPQSLSPQGEDVAAVVKYHNVEAQQSELLKNWMSEAMQGDSAIKGDRMLVRKNIFDHFWDDEQKMMLKSNDKDNPILVSNPKLKPDVLDMFDVYNLADKGMREMYAKYKIKDTTDQLQLELEDERKVPSDESIKNWYMYHMVKEGQVEEFRRWVKDWTANHDGKMPSLSDVVDSKYKLKSYNPEDLFQAKAWQFSNTMKKIRTLETMSDLGLAIRSDDAKGVNKLQYIKRKDPMGKTYWVDAGADKVLQNAWDMQSLFTMPGVGGPARLARNLKGIGSFILTWSLFHPSHIARITFWNALQNLNRNPSMGVHGALNAKTFGLVRSPVLDYFHEKIFGPDLTPPEARDVDHIKMMGLNMGINAEREMQFNFARSLSRWYPAFRGKTSGIDNAVTVAARVLSSEWLQKQMFQEWIPRVKLQAALMSRDDVLRINPKLENPDSRLQLMSELSKRGEAIEARFGEMNMDNLFWQRWAKDAGTAGLLSLGWQLGALRVYGGAVKDLTNNAAFQARNLAGLKADGPRPNADRLTFALYYTLGYAAMNGILSYTLGGKKDLEWRDLWFPVIGQNPQGSQDKWKRAAPGEFPREGYTLYEHMKMKGAIVGTAEYATNKIQPMLHSLSELLQNRNFYGERINDYVLGNYAEQAKNIIGYMMQQNIPITIKQATEEQPGKPGINPLTQPAQFASRLFSMDELMSTLGFPLAPKWAGRTDFVNKIMSAYGDRAPSSRSHAQVEKANMLESYREAIAAKDPIAQKQAEAALTAPDPETGAPKYTSRTLSLVRHEVEKGITAPMYLFWQGGKFEPEEQSRLLKLATPGERAEFFAKGPPKQVAILKYYLEHHGKEQSPSSDNQ